jgi:uncharacterized protein YegL
MIFDHTGALVSGVIVLIIIFLRYKNSRPSFVVPVKKLSAAYLLPLIFRRIMIIVIVVLPLHLGFPSSQEVSIQKPFPVQIILDVSLSMSAYDVQPSRFSVAKDALLHMSKALQGYAFSLISFSGVPVVTIPFTYDTLAFTQAIRQTSLGDFPPVEGFLGTAIGDALLLGIQNIQSLAQREQRTIQDTNKPSGVILLITDGDGNEGYDPKEVLPLLQNQHIPVFVLGIGTAKYLMGYDRSQQPIVSAINTALLETIAKQT